ncbi:hypothetical protein [Propionicicella superfundia]|uniref:hypothetical protein n=1 Tax=Propionicicella superfundia TaxID=348582 RepID=UPI00048BD56E|nr:hypothetical protein [Propionicicella superfundia]
MVSKFGPNGEQMERFIEAAQRIPFEQVESIAAATAMPAVRDAESSLHGVRHSAARYSAVDSAARKLIRLLRQKYPTPTSTAERMPLGYFTSLLTSAVFAFASRPQVDDDTVALVVDPFTEPLGFEWRSWGVSTESVKRGEGRG